MLAWQRRGARDDGRRLAHLRERAELFHRADSRIIEFDQVAVRDELLVVNRFLRGLHDLARTIGITAVDLAPLERGLLFQSFDDLQIERDAILLIGKPGRVAITRILPDPAETDRIDPDIEQVLLGV